MCENAQESSAAENPQEWDHEKAFESLASLLLTAPLGFAPPVPGDRRTGHDRRLGDRRIRAREFSV